MFLKKCRIHGKKHMFVSFLKLFLTGRQIHRKNLRFYRKVVEFIVKTDVFFAKLELHFLVIFIFTVKTDVFKALLLV